DYYTLGAFLQSFGQSLVYFRSREYLISSFFCFFFFQAEDGIRVGHVTGVQTCALPICPSGCGKSTLLRLVAGLDFPAIGRLSMDGQAIDGPDASRIIVFQDPTLYPWRTVWSNVALGLETRGLLRRHRQRVDDALRLVGLAAFPSAYPRQLSGGMAQRAALARALVNDPKLLI